MSNPILFFLGKTAFKFLKFPEIEFQKIIFREETSITIPKEGLHTVISFLKSELGFDILKDIYCVDWYKKNPRFEVGYNLFSLKDNLRLRIKTTCTEDSPRVDSICNLYTAANWYEREAFDMHGIYFSHHPDLRRMYMPDDFNNPSTGEPLYPLRKDFPVMGIPGSLPLPQRD